MIDPEHLKIECWPPRQQGGQRGLCTSPGVKVTHLPSDSVAISMVARSQHNNKQIAIEMIETALTHPRAK